MANRNSVERLSYPVFIVSAIAAAILALSEIWSESTSELRQRVLWSCVVIAVASLFLLAASRRAPGSGANVKTGRDSHGNPPDAGA